MTQEFDFLLASVRRFFRPESPLPSKEGINWDIVFELADRHSVVGFVGRAHDVPVLAEHALKGARSTLAVSAELAKLAALFEREKIEVVPLKGPVLGACLYQQEALKSSTDLDLLVRPTDALRAKNLLETIGYRLESVPHWPSDRGYLRNVNNQLEFYDSAPWLKLDLHWTLLPGYFPRPFDDAELWMQAGSMPWGNTRVRTLSPEHQFLFLSAHGAKHLWARLGWLCDLARLIQVEQGMDWSAVREQARRSHTTRMVSLALQLARDLLGIELSPEAAALAAADARAQSLAAAVQDRLRNGCPASAAAVAAFSVRIVQHPAQRLRLMFGTLQPTEAEYRVVQMPPALYWMYYLLRPLRLSAKYARRLSGL